jgi:hypothetical protein
LLGCDPPPSKKVVSDRRRYPAAAAVGAAARIVNPAPVTKLVDAITISEDRPVCDHGRSSNRLGFVNDQPRLASPRRGESMPVWLLTYRPWRPPGAVFGGGAKVGRIKIVLAGNPNRVNGAYRRA